jgi:hypothetical protein
MSGNSQPEIPEGGEDEAKLWDELAPLMYEHERRFRQIDEAPQIQMQCEKRSEQTRQYTFLALMLGSSSVMLELGSEYGEEVMDFGSKIAIIAGATAITVAGLKAAVNKIEKRRLPKPIIE